MSFNLANRCTYNVQCLLSSIGKYVDWACANALKHGTITVSGIGYFRKNCRFLWKKMFKRQIQEVQYTIHIRHIRNISDFVWFQRSCGSMKSVSSFSSINVKWHQNNKQTRRILTRTSVLKFLNLPMVLSSSFANFKQYDSFSEVPIFRNGLLCISK